MNLAMHEVTCLIAVV